MNISNQKSYQYDAFISYNSKDSIFAEKLEKVLENYKPPKDLKVPHRNLKIFRYEADMIGTEYYRSIENHLRNSAKLIVICSPTARKSEFVNDEISRFAKIHDFRHIIPILIEGIPNNEAKPGQEESLALPDELCKLMDMPLTINYLGFNNRKDKLHKGPYEGLWYQLLANIYDISRDEIEQREKRKQIRRQVITTSIVSSIIVALSILAGIALWQRNIAVKQTKIANQRRLAAELLARRSKAQRLAAESRSLLAEFPQRSILLATEALRVIRPDDPSVPVVEENLRELLNTVSGYGLSGHNGAVLAVSVSSDNRWLATGSDDFTVRLWDLTANSPNLSHKILRGHKAPVVALAFSPDNEWLATGSQDRTIRLWKVKGKSPDTSSVVLNEGSWLVNIVFSPNNQWMVTYGRFSSAKVWDWNILKQDSIVITLQLPANKPEITHIAISPDSRWIATSSVDGIARLWDLNANDPTASFIALQGHDAMLTSIAFSPKGRWLVTTSLDKTARLWDMTNGNPEVSSIALTGHESTVWAAAFSPDGHWLVTTSGDNTIRLWNLTNENPSRNEVILRGFTKPITKIFISPDSRWLAGSSAEVHALTQGTGKVVWIWDLKGNIPPSKPVQLIGHDDTITSMTINADNILITGSKDGTAHVWNLNSYDISAATPKVFIGHAGPVSGVDISPDNLLLATTSVAQFQDEPQQTLLWDLTSKVPDSRPITELHGHKAPQRRGYPIGSARVSFSYDNRWLVTLSEEHFGKAYLWDLTARDITNLPSAINLGDVSDFVISHDNRYIVTANSKLLKRTYSNSELKQKYKDTNRNNIVQLRELNSQNPGKSVNEFKHNTGIRTIALSSHNQWLFTAGDDGVVRWWNISANTLNEKPKTLQGHTGFISSLCISPDDHWLVTTGGELYQDFNKTGDNTVRLWNLRANYPQAEQILLYQYKKLSKIIDISPNSQWLATAGDDNIIHLWNLNLQNPSETPTILHGHKGTIKTLAFSPDSHWLVTGSDDKTVRIWYLISDDPASSSVTLRGHEKSVLTIAISSDSRWLVTGSDDNTARLWLLRKGDLIDLAGHIVGRNLTHNEWEVYLPD